MLIIAAMGMGPGEQIGTDEPIKLALISAAERVGGPGPSVRC